MTEYKPPIILHELPDEMRASYDEKLMTYTMRVLKNYNIEVDEERLLNALRFDRTQYEERYQEGYQEGYAQAKDDLHKAIELILGEKVEIKEV